MEQKKCKRCGQIKNIDQFETRKKTVCINCKEVRSIIGTGRTSITIDQRAVKQHKFKNKKAKKYRSW